MDISKNDTAIVFIDPWNEVLSEKGLAWLGWGERHGNQCRREMPIDLVLHPAALSLFWARLRKNRAIVRSHCS